MHVWKYGCGILVLGVLLSLGSCGLFGVAVNRHLEQRRIATLDLTQGATPTQAETWVDEPTRVRIEFHATVEPSTADYDAADSSATIQSAQVTMSYEVRDATGQVLTRGAGEARGSEILPRADQRSRSTMGRSIDLTYRGEAFEVKEAGRLRIEATVPSTDDEGRQVTSAEAIVWDRVGHHAGRFAAGGLLSMLLGPLVFSLGLLLFVIGLFTRSKGRTDP